MTFHPTRSFGYSISDFVLLSAFSVEIAQEKYDGVCFLIVNGEGRKENLQGEEGNAWHGGGHIWI